MISIKLLSGNTFWMSKYADADGAVYLDIAEETKAQLTRNVEQLTDINKITVDVVLGTTLPATVRNQNLIGKSTNLGVYENDYADFDIELRYGMMVYQQGTMRVLSKKVGNGDSFEVEFVDGSKHWAIILNKTYLTDLDWPTVEYTRSNVWETMNNGAVYTTGDPGYWFPLVNYGRWSDSESFQIQDFRPWVHVAKAFELMFCKAGWQYDCPILQTETGRRLITYVLSENYGKDSTEAPQREFRASVRNAIKLPTPKRKPVYAKVVFDNEISDPGNCYDPTTGVFSKAGVYDFAVKLYAVIYIKDKNIFYSGTSVIFKLIHEYVDGTKIELDGEWKINEREYDHRNDEITFAASDVLVKPGEKVYVEYRGNGDSDSRVTINSNGSVFYNTLKYVVPEEGEDFKLANFVRRDKCLDYIKGISHLFNFRFHTSFAEKKVYIRTPYDVAFFGENASGFYTNTLDDFTKIINYNEAQVTVPNEEKKNYYFKFKSSSDRTIEELKLDEKSDLHSNYIDRGYDFKDETDNFENPYFEPTLNKQTAGTGNNGYIINMPQCVDNDSEAISYNIGPRIVIAAGMVEQEYDTDYARDPFSYFAGVKYDQWKVTYSVPFAYQKTDAKIISFNDGTIAAVPDSMLVYGQDTKDLYNLFYRKYFAEFRDCLTLSLPIVANYDRVRGHDFRKRALINYNGTTQTGRILSFDSYDPDEMTGRILFKADNTNDPACDTYDVDTACDNTPKIIVTDNNDGTFTISAGGTNTSPVGTTTIEHKDEDATTWTTGTTFSVTNKSVVARITWTYTDGCPSQQKTYEVNPCANYPAISFERTLTEPFELSVYESGTHTDTVTGTLYEYSTNGTTWQVIPQPFLLSELPDQVFLRVTVYYEHCLEKMAQTVYFNKPNADDCTVDGVTTPLPMFITSPAGLTIEKRGSFNGKVALDVIKFREFGKDEDWDIYDVKNREILNTDGGKVYEAQRVVIFCNGECPIYCSDIVASNNNCIGVDFGGTSSFGSCDFNLQYENPDDTTSTWSASVTNDTTYVIPKLRTWLEQDCGGTLTNLYDRVIQWDRHNYKTEYTFSLPLGHTVKKFQISVNDAGTVTQEQIDIFVTNVSGDTNNDIKNKLEATIQLNMSAQFGAIAGENYKCIVTVTGGGTTKTVSIAFVAMKVVNATWWGPKKGTDILTVQSDTNVNSYTTATGAEFQEIVTPAPTITVYSPCGEKYSVRYKINTTTKFINDSASDFDNIVLNTTLTVVEDVQTINSGSCVKYSHFPTVTGCSTPSYLWKQGEKTLGTTLNMSVWGDTKARLYVTCTDGCTYYNEY